jgi:hypothetical protein
LTGENSQKWEVVRKGAVVGFMGTGKNPPLGQIPFAGFVLRDVRAKGCWRAPVFPFLQGIEARRRPCKNRLTGQPCICITSQGVVVVSGCCPARKRETIASFRQKPKLKLVKIPLEPGLRRDDNWRAFSDRLQGGTMDARLPPTCVSANLMLPEVDVDQTELGGVAHKFDGVV